jgi:hypothetical protein
MTARTNYIFVDHENVSLADTDALNQEHIRLLVFVGANQKRIDIDAVEAIQKLGQRAQYVRISANGANALDFHIAFYVGRLAQQDERGYFHIISKDKGYDPLIAHLKDQKIFAARSESIATIPFVEVSKSKDVASRIALYLEKLQQPKTTRPSKRSTLRSAISTHFQKALDDREIENVIAGLEKSGVVKFSGEKTIWSLS